MTRLIRAGALDRQIMIERAYPSTDALGAEIANWQPLQAVRAQQITQRAIEAWKAGGTAAQAEVVWRVRWSRNLADVGEQDRITYCGWVYPISGVTEIGRREGLEITTNPSGEQA